MIFVTFLKIWSYSDRDQINDYLTLQIGVEEGCGYKGIAHGSLGRWWNCSVTKKDKLIPPKMNCELQDHIQTESAEMFVLICKDDL